MALDFGFSEIMQAIVPDKRVRIFLYIIVAVGLIAGAAIGGYNTFLAGEKHRIDSRMRPVKIKTYESAAVQEHIFNHLESQLPLDKRHNLDDIRREGRKQLLDDEKVENE